MRRIACAAALAALAPIAAPAQQAVGELTMTIGGEERNYVLIQGSEGPNPGSRYSQLGGDIILTLVAVAGDAPVPPEEAAETVELRFTAVESESEVRSGSVISYTTKDEAGVSNTRGGTTEVTLENITAEGDEVAASGTFSGQLPADEQMAGTDVEGAFRTTVKSREATDP